MICTRRKSKPGMNKRRTGWVPLVLRWRRRDLRPISRLDRVTSLVSLSYFPQIHFHFTTQVSNQYQRLAVQTTVNRNRMLFESYWGTQIYADKAREPRSAYHARINYISSPKFSKHSALYVSSKRSAPILKQIHQPRASASFTSVFPTLLNTRREESTKVYKSHSLTREQRSQILSFRSAQRETLVKSTNIYFDRGEKLVWRRTPPRTTVIEDVPVANITETTNRQPVRTPTVETHVQSASATNR